ncbi:hypothetical protein BD410DRAFT_866374 [Rickenella mellea]|uniref:P-loop containing nucleoside triphosphate hydrolase protein n=1 Tax=Rickenella mellea TaxID=50990 RepID=A0A4Y7Q4S1_9AGAM|nr:hypothetical protein BD410DRAFT_866374 [Rickenella mellea]
MKPALRLLDENVKHVYSAVAKPELRGLDNTCSALQKEISIGSLLEKFTLLVVTILQRFLLSLLHLLKPPRTPDKPTQWLSTPQGCRELCAAIMKGDFISAERLLKVSPALVNTRHPLGWTPLHTAVLSGNLSILKLVADTPGVNFFIKDRSSFGGIFSATDIFQRSEEFSPYISCTVNTGGMTALHFACMVGDWSTISFVIDVCPLFEIKDDEGRVPCDYIDLRRVKVEVLDAYNNALNSWQKRCRSLQRRDISILCNAVRDGDMEFCRETLEKDPFIISNRTNAGWTALHSAVINKQHDILDLFLSKDEDLIDTIDMRDNWNGSVDCTDRLTFANDEFPHRAQYGSTALHYACFMGDMIAANKLVQAGADWDATDGRGLLPEDHINIEHGDEIRLHFKRLCQEEDERRQKEHEADDSDDGDGDETDDSCSSPHPRVSKDDSSSFTRPTVSSPRSGGGKLSGEELERFKREILTKSHDSHPQTRLKRSLVLRSLDKRDPFAQSRRQSVSASTVSSGVGKTELAKQITYYLNDGFNGKATSESIRDIEKSGAFIRIDMSEFQHSHTVSNLTGSPKGYVGYEDDGILTNKLRKNPKALVLLDEIEKAHPNVLTVFLQVFDDGRITDPKFGTIECQDAVFILTSNLGSEQIREAAPELRALVAEIEGRHEEYLRVIGQFNRDLHPILKASLKRGEFLGRINQIVVFPPLNDDEISQVIGNELKKWRKRAADMHGINLSWSKSVVEKLVQAYDVNYGVRSVVNETQRVAVQLLAESQIRGDIDKNWLVHLDIGVIGDIEMKVDDPKSHIPQRRGCQYFLHE